MTERELRRWHRDHSLSKTGLFLSTLGSRDGLTYWTGSASADLVSMVEGFDRAGECEDVAILVNRTHGYPVCFGWVASVEDGRAKAWGHCWNLDPSSGLPTDAARSRINPTGYLGVQLRPADLDLIARFL